MRSLLAGRLLILLAAVLTIANLLCAVFGIGGRPWYTQPIAFLPAITGAAVALVAGANRSPGTLTATLIASWAVALVLSACAVTAFVYSYNGRLEADHFPSLGGYALRALAIGGGTGAVSLLIVLWLTRLFAQREAA